MSPYPFSEFETKIIPKHQRNINGIEDKLLNLYASARRDRANKLSIRY